RYAIEYGVHLRAERARARGERGVRAAQLFLAGHVGTWTSRARDHVDGEVRDELVGRWTVREKARAPQARLFARVPHEQNRATRAWRAQQRTRDREIA